MSTLFFSTIEVTRQAFYRTANVFAIVNLRPMVPGHILVVPARRVMRLEDLTPTEVGQLFSSVQTVGRVLERAYKADGLTIVCQDGKAAGQTIPHVHVHVLPRKAVGDRFEDHLDAVYPAIEEAENELPHDLHAVQVAAEASRAGEEESKTKAQLSPLRVDAMDDRPPRTMEDMIKEAEWLKGWFEPDKTSES